MFLSFPYWMLAVVIIVSWVLHILLSIPPRTANPYDWELIKKLLVAQANRLFYLLFALAIAWVGHNIIFFNHSLSFLVWIVRISAAYSAVKQLLFFVVGLFSSKQTGEGRVTFSNLIVALSSALVALSV